MIYLETERLRLRNWCAADIDELVDYRNDERCTKYQRGQYSERADLAAMIERRKDDVFLADVSQQFAIALRDTDQLVGDISVFQNAPTITLGYTISYKHHRQGYAYEILQAVITALHERYPGREVICLTEPDNVASMNLLRKLGFEDLGYEERITSQVFGLWSIPEV